MILVDANLLIYAIDSDANHHRRALRWFEQSVGSGVELGFAWIVLLAFLRITTHPNIMREPLDAEAAIAYIDEWLALPNTRVVNPGSGHWGLLKGLVTATGTAGNLTSDAHLAAVAIETGGTIYSADADFARFKGVRHVNPLTAAS